MSVEPAYTWINDHSQKPKVVILGVPERETVRAALERLRPAIARSATPEISRDLVSRDLYLHVISRPTSGATSKAATRAISPPLSQRSERNLPTPHTADMRHQSSKSDHDKNEGGRGHLRALVT